MGQILIFEPDQVQYSGKIKIPSIGDTFTDWTVKGYLVDDWGYNLEGIYTECKCGFKNKKNNLSRLVRGKSKRCASCGRKHMGKTNANSLWQTPYYEQYGKLRIQKITSLWCNIKGRIFEKNELYKPWYNIETFTKYMLKIENSGLPGFTCDRIDNRIAYHPNNIRFVDHKVQTGNRQITREVLYKGKIIPLSGFLNQVFGNQFYEYNRAMGRDIESYFSSHELIDGNEILKYVDGVPYTNQQKHRTLLVEGIDHSGKDTLIDQIKTDHMYWHNGVYKDEYKAFYAYRKQIVEIKNSFGREAILNRGFISERIYSLALDRDKIPDASFKILEKYHNEINTTIILCLPPLEVVLKGWRARIDNEFIKDEAIMIKLYELFDNLESITSLPVIRYDYTKTSTYKE